MSTTCNGLLGRRDRDAEAQVGAWSRYQRSQPDWLSPTLQRLTSGISRSSRTRRLELDDPRSRAELADTSLLNFLHIPGITALDKPYDRSICAPITSPTSVSVEPANTSISIRVDHALVQMMGVLDWPASAIEPPARETIHRLQISSTDTTLFQC